MGSPARILIVDDDPCVAQLFAGLLQVHGHEVWTAETGLSGLQATRERRPDVVILDIILPDINGMEVCRRIKAEPDLTDTFVVMLSGTATGPAATVQGLDTGADEYMTKTVDPAEFIARVRTVLRLRDTTVALRQREQHYRGLVEILPDAVVLTDLESRIISVNPQALCMLEQASEGELTGKLLFDLAVAEDRQRMETEFNLTVETGIMRNADYTLVRNTGVQFSAELTAAVTRDESGKASGLLAVIRDSTERKLAERLLRERVEFSRRIISTAMDGFWMIDLRGRLLDVNERYCTMSGYSFAELLAMKISDLEVTETPDAVAAHIEKIVKTGSDRFETRHRRKDGQVFEAEISTTHLHFGGGYLFAFIRDITERKRAQQRLSDALDLNKSMMAASSIGILAYHASGRCIFANEAASRILEAEIEEMPDLLKFPPWRDCGLSGMGEETLKHHRVQTGEVHFTSAAGKNIWLDCHMDSFTSGGEEHVLAMISDVTQRKQAEEELKRLPGRILEAQEAERLRVSRDLHDGVNQTIASAKMRLHGVLEDSSTSIRPSAREILRRCERLMVQALEENRQIAHNLRPSDLDELGFEAACRSFCRNFGARTKLNVSCRIRRLDPRPPAGLELNLFRILQEALNNVDKHAKASTVQVRLAKKRGSIVLTVRDDGRGIGKMKSDKARSTRNGQGGLGLAGIKERTVLLGGICQVDSGPGQGTTISVTVPCGPASGSRSSRVQLRGTVEKPAPS